MDRAQMLGNAGPHVVDSLHAAFQSVHAILEDEGHADWSGTTATVAVIDVVLGTMTVAHVGDSRLIATQGDKVTFATEDHVLDFEEEIRIEALGGEVRVFEVSGVSARRVFQPGQMFPGLSMSRSLGDIKAHEMGVRASPTVRVVPMRPHDCFVLASDGVWQHMTADEVAAIINGRDAWSASRLVAVEARRRWPQGGDVDDITVVTVRPPADMPRQEHADAPMKMFVGGSMGDSGELCYG